MAGGATGYKNSTAYLNFGSPLDFSWISVNNKTMIYTTNSGIYAEPDYYFGYNSLIESITFELP